MIKLNQRLLENYLEEISEYLEYLKTKGYLISQNPSVSIDYTILHYNIDKVGFYQVCYVHEFYELFIKKNLENHYKIRVDNGDLIAMICDILPFVSSEEINNYVVYEKIAAEYMPIDDLQDELTEIIKLSKKLSKGIDSGNFGNPVEQAKVLMRENVFYVNSKIARISEQKKYYKWDSRKNEFHKLSDTEIHKIICNYFKVTENAINIRDCQKEMRDTYPLNVINNDLPIRWNKSIKQQKRLKSLKKDYTKIKKITDEFQ